MSLTIIEHEDPRRFHDRVIGRLLEAEAECCAVIGLVRRMHARGYGPISADELDRPLLLTVEDGSRVDLVGVQTLKSTIMVTGGSGAAVDCVAETLAARAWGGRVILGAAPSVERLAARYAAASGREGRLGRGLRIFQLDRVEWPRGAEGAMRACGVGDRERLAEFVAGFEADIGEVSLEDPLARADRMIADGRAYFWVDGGGVAVAMAAWAGPTPRGIRVNSVYTTPAARGRGYASNLVARLSQQLLDGGRAFCFLFTDRANPTSNRIYQAIGYRAVADCERWEFA